MARNGSGTYTRTHADYQLGEVINPADVNGELNDIATELTNSLDKGGRTTPTANLPLGGFKLTGLGSGSAATDSATLGQIQGGAANFATDSSSGANTFVLSLAPAFAGYTPGLRVVFNATYANTGACTVNIGGAGARNIFWPNGDALAAGDIPVNGLVDIVYSSYNTAFYLVAAPDPLRKGVLTSKGDIITTTGAASGATCKAVGSNGSVLMARSADSLGLAYVPALTGQIRGLTYQINATDPLADIDIAAGGCMDATGAEWIEIPALTKRIDANWAEGTNQGGLDASSVGADSNYHIWAIKNPTSGVTDILFSLSASSPTMPTGYTLKRLIGWARTNSGSQWIPFKTYEGPGGALDYRWSSPTLDVNLAATLTTTRRTDAVKVPITFSTTALLNVTVVDTAGADVYIYCPDLTNIAPGNTTTAPLATLRATVANDTVAAQIEVRTSATGTIAARSSTVNTDQYSVSTLGFRMDRRV